MILLSNRNTGNPYINLAIEEFVVRHPDFGTEDFLLLYINEPAVVLGKNQSVYKEVNFEALKSGAIHVCRRISGGGTVYHDAGNISFAFFSPFAEHKVNNYRYFNRPVVEALQKLGVPAEMDSRNNILCAGKKISGNAQFTNRKVILSHGTLLFNTQLNLLRQALAINPFRVESKAVSSVRSEVMNLHTVLPDLGEAQQLLDYLITELKPASTYAFSEEQWAQINRSADEKFKSADWVYGRSPLTTIHKKEGDITVEEGRIASITWDGLDLQFLIGTYYHYAALQTAIAHLGLADKEKLLARLF